MSPDNRLHELAGRYADGGAAADEVRELEAALRSDPSFRQWFVRYLSVDAALTATVAAAGPWPSPVANPPVAPAPRRLVDGRCGAAGGHSDDRAAGPPVQTERGGASGRGPGCADGRGTTPPPVLLVAATKARWADGDLELSLRSGDVPAGVLRLESGSAEFQFAGGGTALLLGPAAVRFPGEQPGSARRGQAAVPVPDAGVPPHRHHPDDGGGRPGDGVRRRRPRGPRRHRGWPSSPARCGSARPVPQVLRAGQAAEVGADSVVRLTPLPPPALAELLAAAAHVAGPAAKENLLADPSFTAGPSGGPWRWVEGHVEFAAGSAKVFARGTPVLAECPTTGGNRRRGRPTGGRVGRGADAGCRRPARAAGGDPEGGVPGRRGAGVRLRVTALPARGHPRVRHRPVRHQPGRRLRTAGDAAGAVPAAPERTRATLGNGRVPQPPAGGDPAAADRARRCRTGDTTLTRVRPKEPNHVRPNPDVDARAARGRRCEAAAPATQAVDSAVAAREIDAILARHWRAKGIAANPPASDEVFLRRVYLDLAGRIPTVREAEAFYAATDPAKRDRLIDALLGGEGYVQRYFHLWADALRLQSKSRTMGALTGAAYADWLKRSLRDDKPYDAMVRELVTAKGQAIDVPAIGFYVRDTGMPLDHAAVTARVFLGTRIECAQCHDHPFDPSWTQMRFYKTAAFTYGFGEGDYYGRIGLRDEFGERYKRIEAEAADGGQVAKEQMNRQVRGVVTVLNEIQGPFLGNNTDVAFKPADLKLPHDYQYDDAKPFDVVKPAAPFGNPVAPVGDFETVEAYAAWMTSPDNPRFTTVVTNRLWRSLFGRGLIDPLDDLNEKTQADVPELQAYLNRLLVSQRYDMKAFLAVLARTRAYQAEAYRGEVQPGEAYAFTGPLLRRMTAEQVYDSFVTLIRPTPDEPNPHPRQELDVLVRQTRRADAVFRAFPPHELFDRAVAASAVLAEVSEQLKALQAQINAARKAGDKEKAIALGKQADAIQKRKVEAVNEHVVLPALAKLTGKPVQARPHPERNAVYDAIKQARLPGIDPPEEPSIEAAASAAQRRSTARRPITWAYRRPKQRLTPLSERGSWPSGRGRPTWRARPRGHPLREFGQSDRETVDNANPEAGIPQALLLMNGDAGPAGDAPVLAADAGGRAGWKRRGQDGRRLPCGTQPPADARRAGGVGAGAGHGDDVRGLGRVVAEHEEVPVRAVSGAS